MHRLDEFIRESGAKFMRNRIGLIIGGLILVLLGIVIARVVLPPNPVVVFEHSNGEQAARTIPVGYVSGSGELPSLQAFNEAFVKIAETVNPSVVTITTEKVIKTQRGQRFPGFPDDDLFWRFFGLPEGQMKSKALGSGVIVDSKGYILTNNHVVEQGEKIRVKTIDDREYDAEIVGTDSRTDLAVIKIDAHNLKPALLGDSDELRIGEWVLAIGSPFSENLAHTVTAGIVSAKGRSNIMNGQNYESFIQTDAAINPGNSGGALVNIRGELIGINTAIATAGYTQGNIGIGFAIPINLAKKIMSDLIEKGKVTRAWLGVMIGNIDDGIARSLNLDNREGSIISEVVKKSPAAEAGLKVGDIIIEFDGKKIKDTAQLRNLVANSEIGKTKTLVVLRDKKPVKVDVRLGELTDVREEVRTSKGKPSSRLGIRVDEITPYIANEYNIDPDETGVVVTGVNPETPAAQIIRTGDIIKRVGEQEIRNLADYQKAISNLKSGLVLLLIKRGEATFFETLDLGK